MKVYYSALFLILLHGIAYAQCEDFILTVSNVQLPSCPGSADGAIALSVAGAQGTASYAWSETGLSGPAVSGLAPGTYSVTATDDGGCTAVETLVLEANLTADAGPDIKAYCGAGQVSLGGVAHTEVYFSSDITPIEFSDSNQDLVPFRGISGKVGFAPAPDSFDPASSDSLFVEAGSATASSGDVVCLPVRVYNFTDIVGAAFTINYDPAHLNFIEVTGLNPGLPGFSEVFNIIAPNTGLNDGFIAVNYFEPSFLGVSLSDGSTLFTLCFEVVDISGTSAGPDIIYQWTGPNNFTSTEPFPQVAQSGAYTLRVTDSSQPDCWAEDEVEVLFQPDSIGVVLRDTLTPCLSQPVALEPEISGGQGPFSYLWSNGDTTQSITVASSATPADYTLTVTSADGCTGLAGATVEAENNSPPVISLGPDREFCSGQPFSLSATVTGGPSPFSYIWNDGLITANPDRLVTLTTPITYWADVVDANGCRSAVPDSIDLTPFPQFTLDLGPDHYLCTPEQVFLSGPPAATSYAWSTGQATQTAIVQPAQTSTYYLTITNSFGCTATDTIVIHIGLQNLDITSPICDDNGTPANPDDDTFTFQATIDGNPGGGWVSNLGPTGSYGTTATFGPFLISAGDVTLTIVDSNNPDCVETVVVASPQCEPDICEIFPNFITETCDFNGTPSDPNDDTFTLSMRVDGILTGLFWAASDGSTGPYGDTITFGPFPLNSGPITITFSDADNPGCSATFSHQPPICDPAPCVLNAAVQNISCDNNGTPLDPSDDTFTFQTIVDNIFGSSWVSSLGPSGDYGQAVTFGPFLISNGDVIFTVTDTSDPNCITNLFVASSPTCSDSPNCDLQAVVQEVLCNDNGTPADTTDDTFTLEILVTGGLGSGWVEDSSGLSGDYGVPFTFGPYPADYGHVGLIFVDADDPSCFDIFDLYTPAPCTIDCQQNPILLNFDVVFPTCFGTADGEAIAIVEGGGGGYTYQWSNGVTTSANINLPGGEYFVTVTDIFGCQAIGEATIAEPPLLTLDIQATPVSCSGGSDGAITLFITGGSQSYTYFWTGPNGFFSTEFSLTNIPGGLYTVTATDANGCSITETIEVWAGNPIDLTLEAIQQPACPTSNDGILMADASGGEGPYEYIWATGFVGPTHTGLGPGIYSVTVVDVNGCTGTGEMELEALLIADAGPGQAITCNDTDVVLDGSSSTAGPNILYEWTGPGGFSADQLAVTVSEEGTYLLQVTDLSQPGCTAQDAVEVFLDTVPADARIDVNYVSCDSIILSHPSFANQTWVWILPNGETSNELSLGVTESGLYKLVATNLGNGCSAADSVLVNLDPSLCATLEGRLVRDSLPDCSPGVNEPGLDNWLIVIQGGGRVYYAVTQAGGYYEQSLPVGDYLVYPLLPNLLWIPCQNNYLVSLQAPGEMAVLDIPVVEAQPCPELSVDFSLPLLRRCWSRSLFINYCNDGTAPAEDATVVVTLDDFFTFQSATAPLFSQDGNQYTFEIGDVAVNQCGSFIIYVEVSCDAIVGQSLCAEAKIFPNGPCFPASPNWSGASLQVEGACEGGEVQFRVENVGPGDMAAPLPCIVIEDGVMLLANPDNILLNSGEAFTYNFPANGSTYRIEVEQEPFHPGFSMPVAVLEGCGENDQGTFSTGFVNQLALGDSDPFIDIECREVVGSYDPNDKHGFPRGYGDENYIYPGTDIEYLVQFQNTGNDTAFLVVIRDTLSPFLDITSVQPGAASHPYTWDIDSNNILVFTFEEILLPDSTTNLEGSQGFVEFKVAQQDSLPLGTVIENSAAIYFDVNDPIITNTTVHTLGYDFIEVISFTPELRTPELRVTVMPNPVGEWAQIQLDGWPGGEGLFELFDLQGRRLRERRFSGTTFRFERRGLPAGVYAFRIVDEHGSWGSGRLVIGLD